MTVLRPSGPVPFGERRPTASVSHTVDGCLFAPTGGFELTAGQDTSVTQPTLYCPPGTDIAVTDRVQVRDETYEVDGVPAVWRSPWTGDVIGVAVRLRGAEG